jgi:hypothetical protein
MADVHVFRLEQTTWIVQYQHADGTLEPHIIVADSGYQDDNEPQLLTPYKTSVRWLLTDEQQRFNRELGRVRIIVENFNGRLKEKKQILQTVYEDTDLVLFEQTCSFASISRTWTLSYTPSAEKGRLVM